MRKKKSNFPHTLKAIFIGLFVFASLPFYAQKKDKKKGDETEYTIDQNTREFIENIVEDSDAEFDFNEIFDRLAEYQRRPLNINKATVEELGELYLFSPIQITSLLEYRKQVGELISIYEMQAIPYFDLATINRILPYVKISKNLETFNVPFHKMLVQGKNELFVRYARILEKAEGFTREDSTGYLGDPNKYFVRFKHSFENRHSWGFTLEKDAGEEFFSGSNKQGFDFNSFHVYYRNLSSTVKAIALGDYSANLGQGLIMAGGFGSGKSSYVANIKRSGRTLRPYTSVNEALFLRGLGATLAFTPNLEFSAFGSYRNRDANVTQVDTTDNFEDITTFSSLQLTGLHRRASEIEDEAAIQQMTVGGNLKLHNAQSHIGINAIYNKFNADLNRNLASYNQFTFNSGALLNLSLDYSLLIRNFNIFGETAYSDNGAIATLNGMIIGVDRKIDFAILQRHFSKKFQHLYGNPFQEGSSGTNESGVYVGLDIKPNYNWQISGYFDIFSHPWMRFRVDGPSNGFEYLAQVKYRVKRKMEIYFRFRDEIKQQNAPDNETNTDFLNYRRKSNFRLHLSNKVSKALELRNRIDFVIFNDKVRPTSYGFMLYQDIIYKPIGIPLSFTGRFAIFDTDNYDSRIYAFENDLLYSFSVPAYAYQGMRYYLNLRYKGIRNLTLELRLAQTYIRNRDSFSAGLEEIPGHTKTEVKAQVKFKF